MLTEGLYIGLMSGTSLDGVDAVVVDFAEDSTRTLGSAYVAYPDEVRREALNLNTAGLNEAHRSAVLANTLADLYANAALSAARMANVSTDAINAIGCHGQTIRHNPMAGYSIQINAPARLAELTGIDVICDFRSRDIAAGGQGAPLVPAVHRALFQHPSERRIILNLGGIANLTRLTPHQPVLGFDCGPANMMLDAWIQHVKGLAYDADGEWAGQGKVIPELLDNCLRHPFFTLPPPKSCGREQFNLEFITERLIGNEHPSDVQATLAALTVTSCVTAIHHWCDVPEGLYVCGGGVRNQMIMRRLQQAMPLTRVTTTDALGVPADQVEAVAFAWLAFQHKSGRPGNLAEVTGARGPRILGACYPA